MNFATWFSTHLSFLPPQIAVMITSMLPLIELRGGIPLARLLELPLSQAIIFSVIGNVIPLPFILLFIRKIFHWLSPTKLLGGIVRKLEARAMGKSDSIKKAEFWGLMCFVGIPLPGTGGWTGTLIAALLKIDFKKALLAALCGVAMAATIMSLIAYGIFG
ncbi:MAG: small multi-drug export protein [Lachnospiraceae bacterium]|nr:small multi-drug export protein [Candidatus Equihabitans merdae]